MAKMILYTIYAGLEFDSENKKISSELANRAKSEVETMALNRFGGYTIQTSDGGYRSDANGDIKEKSLVVELIGLETDYNKVEEIIDNLKFLLSQESIMLITEEVDVKFI